MFMPIAVLLLATGSFTGTAALASDTPESGKCISVQTAPTGTSAGWFRRGTRDASPSVRTVPTRTSGSWFRRGTRETAAGQPADGLQSHSMSTSERTAKDSAPSRRSRELARMRRATPDSRLAGAGKPCQGQDGRAAELAL
ncbi:MAG: hypothetical protein U9Q81_20600 [Pseudomonadota bacterium]|nr:hypothetical protein [Pseudomonadota bacterium]